MHTYMGHPETAVGRAGREDNTKAADLMYVLAANTNSIIRVFS